MLRNVMLFAVIALLNAVVIADDDSLARWQFELTAVLKWEILWDDSPAGFQLPDDGKAQVVLLRDSNSLSYCSTHLGVCAHYRTDLNRNWMRDAEVEIGKGQNDEKMVREFASKHMNGHQRGDGFAGSSSKRSAIVWTAGINLGNRQNIIRQYREMRPQGIGPLEDWIRASRTRKVKSITIACFAPSDPMVYYLVDQLTYGSVVMAAYWNTEKQEWHVAGSLDRSEGPERFEQMRRTIESLACLTLD